MGRRRWGALGIGGWVEGDGGFWDGRMGGGRWDGGWVLLRREWVEGDGERLG